MEAAYHTVVTDEQRDEVEAWMEAHQSEDIDNIDIYPQFVSIHGRNVRGADTTDTALRQGFLTADLDQALANLHRRLD